MNSFLLRRAAICLIAGVAASTVLQAQTAARDPLDGTWQLNVAKSTMSGPGASSSETIVFKVNGEEESFESKAVQASDGAMEHTGYKASYGGPSTPMASIYVLPSGVVSRVDLAQVKVIKIDSHTRERIVSDSSGRQRMRAQRKVSADGKTLYGSILGPDGKAVQVRVFDRVK